MSTGKSVRMFLVDGIPGGLVTAEIVNWTGHVLAGPRSDLSTILQRGEAHRTGVYLLVGDAPDSVGGMQVYVGEGDDIGVRLGTHARDKDFWQRCVIITSKDANLTKAHARYLESRLIALAQSAQRYEVTNVKTPPLISLPEADVSDMEQFISQVGIALPVLGLNLLRSARGPQSPMLSPNVQGRSPAQFTLTQKREGLTAHAVEVDGEFTVLAGSRTRHDGSSSGSYSRLREQLEADGTIDTRVEPAVFTKDQTFGSPSAAASVVTGRASNGRVAWVSDDTGLTYGDWQNREL